MATTSASCATASISSEASTETASWCCAPERETTVTRSVRVSRRGLMSTTWRPAMLKRRSSRSISSVLPQNMQPAMTWTQPCV